jgi:hypothetical protein
LVSEFLVLDVVYSQKSATDTCGSSINTDSSSDVTYWNSEGKMITLVPEKHYLLCKVRENNNWVEVIFLGYFNDPIFHWQMAKFEELTIGAEWTCTVDV